jgi:OOP family OmpA-OmpF porin
VPPQPPVTPQPVSRASEAEKQLVEKGVIRLDLVYFETGSAKLLPESETTLHEAGAALEKYPDLRVEVEGHTDTRGSAAYNMTLSQDRAESVRGWLLGHHRLRGENLMARGYGESRPETRERNEEELLRNRRVVLRVLNPEALPKNVEIAK